MKNIEYRMFACAARMLTPVVILLASGMGADAQVVNAVKPCSGVTVDPAKDFVSNFNNACYALPFVNSVGGSNTAGDLNATYDRMFYQVTPGYELIVLGTFPNARYFSVTVYDSHAVGTSEAIDSQIHPLNATMSNPFVPFTAYTANQQYGITVGFGGGVPVNTSPGCGSADSTIDENFLDASQIHQGVTWSGFPGLPAGFPAHLTGANPSGAIFARTYYGISADTPPVVIVRQLSTGCAITAQDAKTQGIISASGSATQFQNSAQVGAHEEFANQIESFSCYAADPYNEIYWSRGSNYVPGNNEDAAYLVGHISSDTFTALRQGKQFIRMRFQLPAMPSTPCSSGSCYLTGAEELRYRSISFQNGTTTLASLKDDDFVRDSQGNVSLIVGIGSKPPSYVTAANGYTYLNLAQAQEYKDFSQIALRDILPNSTFSCSAFNVPFLTSETNPVGGYMGNYVPTVDFPIASEIPQAAVPFTRLNTCLAMPRNPPQACGPRK